MSCVVPSDLDGANCANILIVRLNQSYDPYYLSYLVNSSYGQRTLLGSSVGSAQGVINTTRLKEWQVYDIPTKQQKQFRYVVQEIHRLNNRLASSVALTSDLASSLAQSAFPGGLS